VDRRADIWALGCLLYECLTARQTFEGETVSDVIARVLEREPEWSALPASTPRRLRELIQRCLTKDVAQRPRDAGDLRLELAALAMELEPSSRMAPAAKPDLPSLAVLYFENPASDPESEYFCAGITEDILTDLSKIKGLRVASRNAVLRYRGSPVDLGRVASDLGVRSVLEGSVRRAGDRVRITAQLINAADGFHLWAERYDRTLADVFAVQEEIAKSIADALRVTLTPAETAGLAQDRPDDVRAYDLYLRGRERYGSYTPESLREALDLFRQAITIDSDYALAWAGVADCYGQLLQFEVAEDTEEAGRLGLEAARRAISINPHLAEGHKAEALVLLQLQDRTASKAALQRAVAANPRFTPALINLGVEAVCDANMAEAERMIRRALEIDPQEAFAAGWLAYLLWLTGRGDEMLLLADRLRELSDDPFYVTASYTHRARYHWSRGDLPAVEAIIREGITDGARPDSIAAIRAALAARAGRDDEARECLREVGHKSRLAPQALVMAAWTAIHLGEIELAMRFLDRKFLRHQTACVVRLEQDLHPLLEREPFAPRRSPLTLVWPLEAPMIDAARHALFREVRIESGLPQGSDVLPR
jgi:TolB-like protein/Flp pilus assembly protein TadD